MTAGILLAVVPPVFGPPRVAAKQRPGSAPGPVPPQSHAYGKTLTEWMKLLTTWTQGGDQGDSVGNVRFLPTLIPVTDDPRLTEIDGFPFYVDTFDVTVKPGTALAVGVFGVVAETYNPNGGQPADNIHDPSIQELLRQTFSQVTVLVELDGCPLLDSRSQNLRRYVSDPYDFDETLFYDEPKVGLVDPGPPPVYVTSYCSVTAKFSGSPCASAWAGPACCRRFDGFCNSRQP